MDEQKQNKFKENKYIICGSIIAVLGIISPFILLLLKAMNVDLIQLEELAGVGDFLGGTTVGLLSFAGIIFVTAAIVMQKEELKLQREELHKTREEYKLTNETLKKQQFETTFFNMINLHHNLIKDLKAIKKIGEAEKTFLGRDAFDIFHHELNIIYLDESKKKAANRILSSKVYSSEDFEKYFLSAYLQGEKNKLLREEREKGQSRFLDRETIERNYKAFEKEVHDETSQIWLDTKKISENIFNDLIKNNNKRYTHIINNRFRFLNWETDKSKFIHKIETDYYTETIERPKNTYKVEALEIFFQKYENELGHVYRNVYVIIKLILDEKEYIDYKKYIRILRSQLSSMELLFIFYNVTYTERGRKFKELISGLNFFDNHLNREKFIWNTDFLEVEKINTGSTSQLEDTI